jgi:hypothetical protein
MEDSKVTTKPDDLDAVRSIVEILQPFAGAEQERILRWVREKCNLVAEASGTPKVPSRDVDTAASLPSSVIGQRRDLRMFVDSKAPGSDGQFAATVAYFFRFESDESQRKQAITADDLLEACRVAGRARLPNPGQTLRNAHRDGLLSRSDRGTFSINAVGENLVAMALPATAPTGTVPASRSRSAVRLPKKAATIARAKRRTKKG